MSRKISLSFLLSAMGLTAACVAVVYYLSKDRVETNILSHLSTAAQSRADNIELYLDEQAGDAELLAREVSFKSLLLARDEDLARGLSAGESFAGSESYTRSLREAWANIPGALKRDAHFVGLGVVDRAGTVLVANPNDLVGISVRDKEHFRLQCNATHISDLYISAACRKPVVGISVPVRESGRFIGVVFVELSAVRIFELLLDGTGLGDTGETYLVNGEGYMVSPSRFISDAVLNQKVESMNLAQCRSHMDGRHLYSCADMGTFEDYRGEMVFGTHQYLPRMDWALLAEIDVREVLAPLRRLRATVTGFLFAVPLVALLIGTYVSRSIAGPIEKLRAGAVAVGKGDFGYRVNATSKDEIGELGRAFDEMAEGLGKATTTIDRLNAEIEERHRAQRALVQLERLKALEEMAAGVSHNLNNILVGVMGHAQLLENSTDSPEVLDEVRAIVKSARRAENLVDRLTLAVRGEDAEQGPVDVVELAQEVVNGTLQRLKIYCKEHANRVSMRLNHGYVPLVRASRSGVVQILNNLIQNSVEAMPDGGEITVGLVDSGDCVTLTVSDTGVGMDVEIQSRVIEPFFTTKAEVGKGLGLSAVYGLVTRWGGHVAIESEPGVGSSVTVTLPAWRRSAVEEAEANAEAEGGKGRPGTGRVLVVDDEDMITRTLRDCLGSRYDITVAGDGQEALEFLKAEEYDVALIDLGLPGLPGDMLAVRIKERSPGVVTVLMTGWNIGEGDPMVEGFDLWLRKPFESLSHVRETLARALDLHSKRNSSLLVASNSPYSS